MRLPPRRAHKVDANQREVIHAFEAAFCTVLSVGHPFDLLVGIGRRWITVEVKDGSKPPSKQLLTEDEERFAALCRARGLPFHVVRSLEDVELVLRLERCRT